MWQQDQYDWRLKRSTSNVARKVWWSWWCYCAICVLLLLLMLSWWILMFCHKTGSCCNFTIHGQSWPNCPIESKPEDIYMTMFNFCQCVKLSIISYCSYCCKDFFFAMKQEVLPQVSCLKKKNTHCPATGNWEEFYFDNLIYMTFSWYRLRLSLTCISWLLWLVLHSGHRK